MKKVLLIFLSVAILLGLSSCGSNSKTTTNNTFNKPETKSENSLVGTWYLVDEYGKPFESDSDEYLEENYEKMILFSDGTCSIDAYSKALSSIRTEQGKWKIVDGKFKVTGPNGGDFFVIDTLLSDYQINGNTLKLTNIYMDGKLVDKSLFYRNDITDLNE